MAGLFSSYALAITDGQNFQDWRAKCLTTEDKKTNCHIFQDLSHKESGKRILHIAIGKLPDQDILTMILTLPLGIALPQGVAIGIDGENGKRLPIQACFASGCQTAFQPESEWIDKFAAGKTAQVIFHNIQNQAISIPVSLKGVTAGIKALRSGK